MSIPSLQDLNPEALSMLRRLDLLLPVVRAAIVADAVSSIELPRAQTDQIWQNHLKNNNLEQPDQLTQHLKGLGISQEDLRWQLELKPRIQTHSRENFQHKAEARFLARKEALDIVVYSLLRVKDPFLARELYLRIHGKEENFADLALAYSEGPEASTKGIVGPVPMNQAHGELAERLRTSQPGQLLEPFKLLQFWVVTRLERYEAARFDQETGDVMAVELFKEWIEEKVICTLATL